LNFLDAPAYHHIIACELIVDLPGYDGNLNPIPSELPNEEFGHTGDFIFGYSGLERGSLSDIEILDINGWPEENTYFERTNDGDTFQFTFQELLPRDMNGFNWADEEGIFRPGWTVFTSLVDQVQFSDGTGISSGNNDLLIPIDPIDIDWSRRKITLIVSLDTEGLIELYDHGTPGDKTDDIVVIADKYWERFAFDIIYE